MLQYVQVSSGLSHNFLVILYTDMHTHTHTHRRKDGKTHRNANRHECSIGAVDKPQYKKYLHSLQFTCQFHLNLHPIGEKRYNKAHKKTRCTVERSFGIWKSRFRCLHKSGGNLQYSPERCVKIIAATAVLHNICREKSLPLLFEDKRDPDFGEIEQEEEDHVGDGVNIDAAADGRQARAELIQSVFD